jgi:CMP-N,N'-diacetyllegionaminic acid synthase
MKVLGIIPARGGSKSVPNKNIASVDGRPLIAYTIEAAKTARSLTHFIVSTDDEKIAATARAEGAAVPFMRPPELATDDAETLPVLLHAIEQMERTDHGRYDVIVLLQPTTPLRTGEDIDAGLRLLEERGADSVVSVVDVGGNHPFRMKRLLDDGRLMNYIDQGFEDMRPRQRLPAVYIRSGALYISRRSVLVEQQRMVGDKCYGLVIPRARAVNIDEPTDLYVAERLLVARRRNPR